MAMTTSAIGNAARSACNSRLQEAGGRPAIISTDTG
jgi:hypothetical protein